MTYKQQILDTFSAANFGPPFETKTINALLTLASAIDELRRPTALQAKIDGSAVAEMVDAWAEPVDDDSALAKVENAIARLPVGSSPRDIAHAALAELAKMPVELPTEKEILAFVCIQRGDELHAVSASIKLRDYLKRMMTPILAAKDTTIEYLRGTAKHFDDLRDVLSSLNIPNGHHETVRKAILAKDAELERMTRAAESACYERDEAIKRAEAAESREPRMNGKPFVEHLRDILGALPHEGVLAAIERLQREKATAETLLRARREELRDIRYALGQAEHVGTLAEDVAALLKKCESATASAITPRIPAPTYQLIVAALADQLRTPDEASPANLADLVLSMLGYSDGLPSADDFVACWEGKQSLTVVERATLARDLVAESVGAAIAAKNVLLTQYDNERNDGARTIAEICRAIFDSKNIQMAVGDSPMLVETIKVTDQRLNELQGQVAALTAKLTAAEHQLTTQAPKVQEWFDAVDLLGKLWPTSEPIEDNQSLRDWIQKLHEYQVNERLAVEAKIPANEVQNSEREQYDRTIKQQIAALEAKDTRIAELETKVATVGKDYVERWRLKGAERKAQEMFKTFEEFGDGVCHMIQRAGGPIHHKVYGWFGNDKSVRESVRASMGWLQERLKESPAASNTDATDRIQELQNAIDQKDAFFIKCQTEHNELVADLRAKITHLNQSLDQQAKLIGTDHAETTRVVLEYHKLEARCAELQRQLSTLNDWKAILTKEPLVAAIGDGRSFHEFAATIYRKYGPHVFAKEYEKLDAREQAACTSAVNAFMVPPVAVDGKTPGETFVAAFNLRMDDELCRDPHSDEEARADWASRDVFNKELHEAGARFVLRAFGNAAGLHELRDSLTLEDDPSGYFRAKIDETIAKMRNGKAPKEMVREALERVREAMPIVGNKLYSTTVETARVALAIDTELAKLSVNT
jgi:hypothetical protein